MKYAFTLIELIITIILIAILAIFVSNPFEKDTLVPATNQVLDHIRYTQQLALNQDMYVPSPDFSLYTDSEQRKKDSMQWFKKWWQIQFHTDNSYTVYSDYPSDNDNFSYDNKPVHTENGDTIAKDPFEGKYIAGSSTDVPAEEVIKTVDLSNEFGVSIAMTGCRYGSRHIMFDEMGKPHCTKTEDDSELNPYDRMAHNGICLELSDGSETSTIRIEPITGYASVAYGNTCP